MRASLTAIGSSAVTVSPASRRRTTSRPSSRARTLPGSEAPIPANWPSPSPRPTWSTNGPSAMAARVATCSAASTGCHRGRRYSAPARPVAPLGQQPAEDRGVLQVGRAGDVVVAHEQRVEAGLPGGGRPLDRLADGRPGLDRPVPAAQRHADPHLCGRALMGRAAIPTTTTDPHRSQYRLRRVSPRISAPGKAASGFSLSHNLAYGESSSTVNRSRSGDSFSLAQWKTSCGSRGAGAPASRRSLGSAKDTSLLR